MKNFARLLALVLVLVMAVGLVGCGVESKIAGKWEGTLKEEGFEMDVTFEFDKKEGEVTLEASFMGESQKETLDYEFEDDKLLIDGDEVDYEFDGKNTLILEIDGQEFELERVK